MGFSFKINEITVAKSHCKNLPRKNFLPTSLALDTNRQCAYDANTTLPIYKPAFDTEKCEETRLSGKFRQADVGKFLKPDESPSWNGKVSLYSIQGNGKLTNDIMTFDVLEKDFCEVIFGCNLDFFILIELKKGKTDSGKLTEKLSILSISVYYLQSLHFKDVYTSEYEGKSHYLSSEFCSYNNHLALLLCSDWMVQLLVLKLEVSEDKMQCTFTKVHSQLIRHHAYYRNIDFSPFGDKLLLWDPYLASGHFTICHLSSEHTGEKVFGHTPKIIYDINLESEFLFHSVRSKDNCEYKDIIVHKVVSKVTNQECSFDLLSLRTLKAADLNCDFSGKLFVNSFTKTFVYMINHCSIIAIDPFKGQLIRKFSVEIEKDFQNLNVINWSGDEMFVLYNKSSVFSGNNSDTWKIKVFSLLTIEDMTLLKLSRMAVLKSYTWDRLANLRKAYLKLLGIC